MSHKCGYYLILIHPLPRDELIQDEIIKKSEKGGRRDEKAGRSLEPILILNHSRNDQILR